MIDAGAKSVPVFPASVWVSSKANVEAADVPAPAFEESLADPSSLVVACKSETLVASVSR
jgi:hypothetical protein